MIAVVWAASALSAIVSGEFEILQLTTPVMLLAAGYGFGLKVIREVNDVNHERRRRRRRRG